MKNNKKGFTLIELLVVIAIIGLLATLSVVALNTARVKARDARRVSDIKQIQTALEMYFDTYSSYPTATSDANLAKYMDDFPVNPSPQADGSNCTGFTNYIYAQASSGASYNLTYCLSSSGKATATPAGIK